MLTIRLARVGKKNKAQFQIVLQEHAVAPGGKHVEILGSYDPHAKKEVLKTERIKYWVSKGAQVSDTAYNLFVSKGVLEGEKRKVKLPAKKAEPAAAEASFDAKSMEDKMADKEVKEDVKTEAPKEEAGAKVKAEEVKTGEAPKEEAKTQEAAAETKAE